MGTVLGGFSKKPFTAARTGSFISRNDDPLTYALRVLHLPIGRESSQLLRSGSPRPLTREPPDLVYALRQPCRRRAALRHLEPPRADNAVGKRALCRTRGPPVRAWSPVWDRAHGRIREDAQGGSLGANSKQRGSANAFDAGNQGLQITLVG